MIHDSHFLCFSFPCLCSSLNSLVARKPEIQIYYGLRLQYNAIIGRLFPADLIFSFFFSSLQDKGPRSNCQRL